MNNTNKNLCKHKSTLSHNTDSKGQSKNKKLIGSYIQLDMTVSCILESLLQNNHLRSTQDQAIFNVVL